MTAEERDEQLELVKFLIDERRVTTWTELGKVLGVSRQAAQARFGADGAGLSMPTPSSKIQHRIYLGLTDDLVHRLRSTAGDELQEYIRSMLDQNLPRSTSS